MAHLFQINPTVTGKNVKYFYVFIFGISLSLHKCHYVILYTHNIRQVKSGVSFLEIVTVSKNESKIIYSADELAVKGIDIGNIFAKKMTHNSYHAMTQLQNLIGQDIIDHRIVSENCLCEISLCYSTCDNSIVATIRTGNVGPDIFDEKEDDYISETVLEKSSKLEPRSGYVYVCLAAMMDAAMVPDVFKESRLLKTLDNKYVLRCMAEDVEKAKMLLCEFGSIVDPPRNWDTIIRKDAIKSLKQI